MNKQYMDIIPPNFKWFKTNNGYNGVRIKVEGAWPGQCSWGDCVRPAYKDGACYFAYIALNSKTGPFASIHKLTRSK